MQNKLKKAMRETKFTKLLKRACLIHFYIHLFIYFILFNTSNMNARYCRVPVLQSRRQQVEPVLLISYRLLSRFACIPHRTQRVSCAVKLSINAAFY